MSLMSAETAVQSANVRRALRRMSAEEATPLSELSWSSLGWCVYFRVNRSRLIHIPWECGAELTAEEQKVLIPSIQEFQLAPTGNSKYRHCLIATAVCSPRNLPHA